MNSLVSEPLSQMYSSRSYLANLYQNSHLSSLNVATSWTCSAKRAWSVRPSAATREILVCEKVNNPDTSVANKEAACPEAAAALFSASRPGDVHGSWNCFFVSAKVSDFTNLRKKGQPHSLLMLQRYGQLLLRTKTKISGIHLHHTSAGSFNGKSCKARCSKRSCCASH